MLTHVAGMPNHLAKRDPWPWPDLKWEALRLAAWYHYYNRPARLYPAANFCPFSAKPKPAPQRRLPTEQLPAITLAVWEQEWIWMDPVRTVTATPPIQRRRFERVHRFLDHLINVRQGKGWNGGL